MLYYSTFFHKRKFRFVHISHISIYYFGYFYHHRNNHQCRTCNSSGIFVLTRKSRQLFTNGSTDDTSTNKNTPRLFLIAFQTSFMLSRKESCSTLLRLLFIPISNTLCFFFLITSVYKTSDSFTKSGKTKGTNFCS